MLRYIRRHHRLDVKKMGNHNLIGMEVSCPLVGAYRKTPAHLAHQVEWALLVQDEVVA